MELIVTVIILAIGFFFGRRKERAHLAELDEREAATSHVIVTDLARLPVTDARSGELVAGSAVIASDSFKAYAAWLRGLVGGEIRSLVPLVERARREARQRMVDEAIKLGAVTVVNVRFETSDVGNHKGKRGGPTEVFCYGTALVG